MRPVLPRLRPRGAASLIALLAAVGFLASACGGGDGFTYVSSTDRKAYFKVPAGWTFFDKRDILVASGQSLSEETDKSLPWLIGYDAAPDPAVDHVLNKVYFPEHPVVFARAEVLNFQARDSMSLRGIRNYHYPVDGLIDSNFAELISRDEDIVFPGGLHGSRYVYDIHAEGVTGVTSGGSVLRVDQTGILDARTNTLYFFVIRCESHCYRDNKALIDQIASSWTVKER
jgi:hypothetical protein